jgi:Zn-dependent peptidase ImmA (M78 family)
VRHNPEEAARVARLRLGVEVGAQLSWRSTDAAVRHWRSALESAGVLVFRFRMPVDELRGFSIRGHPPMVAITNQDTPPAQSFTLFHEWSHLLLGESGICKPSELGRSDRVDDVEVFCNAFAGALLVPMAALESTSTVARLRVRELGANEAAVAIARAFSVSRFVALRRLLAARAITGRIYGEVVAAWMQQPTAVRRSRFGPEPAVRTISELGRPFVTTVLSAQQTGKITETDAADYLSIAGKHLERVTELVGV